MDKEKLRKERQRQRCTETARDALNEAIHRMEDIASLDAGCVQAAEEAERARVAAEAAEAAAAAGAVAEAAAAAERLQLEEETAALTLRLQQMHARLGVVAAAAPAPQAEAQEALCLVCMDAPNRYAMVPCMHMCACEACAQQLLHTATRSCPVCREPIQRTTRVFF